MLSLPLHLKQQVRFRLCKNHLSEPHLKCLMDLTQKTVKELRQICKAAGIRRCAWKRKTELVFMILELPDTCVCCKRGLTSEEMGHFLHNPEQGPNCWNDDEHGPTPCCTACNFIKPGQCDLCGTWWMEYNLRCGSNKAGNPIISCYDCNWCTECGKQLHGLAKENWVPESEKIVCDECCLLE